MYISSPYRLAVIHNNALQHKIWQAAFPSAKTPMDIFSPYRLAVTQHKCTAALDLARSIPFCSVVFYKPN